MIRISAPILGEAEEQLVLEVLRSGRLAQGPMVERFEALCADMAGVAHAVAVANGTVSLEAALAVVGVGPGDEVVTSPFTFAATLNAILGTGATAVFADIGEDANLDPDAAGDAISGRTRVVMPVHLYGLPADMDRLAPLARSAGAVIVEDAAQAHGASIGEARVGSFGIGSFSFYATKNVTAGEGGVLTTDDAEVDRHLRLLRNQGMAARYQYEMVGRNLRMTELQAAVAIPQMERLGEINRRRQENAAGLQARLADVDGLGLPVVPAGRTHVWHQFTVTLPDGADRDAVAARMHERGVESGVYYPRLVHEYDAYAGRPDIVIGETPNARRFASHCLSLPVHPGLTDADLDEVAAALRAALA